MAEPVHVCTDKRISSLFCLSTHSNLIEYKLRLREMRWLKKCNKIGLYINQLEEYKSV